MMGPGGMQGYGMPGGGPVMGGYPGMMPIGPMGSGFHMSGPPPRGYPPGGRTLGYPGGPPQPPPHGFMPPGGHPMGDINMAGMRKRSRDEQF